MNVANKRIYYSQSKKRHTEPYRRYTFYILPIITTSIIFLTTFLIYKLLMEGNLNNEIRDILNINRNLYIDVEDPESGFIIGYGNVNAEENQRKKVLGHSNHKLAVLVPFRNRFEELLQFAPYMHNFLNDQNIDHHIFVLNQVDTFRFNRASLINAGYLQTREKFDYIAMHDVDLLPLNKELMYLYPEQPFHLASPKLHPRYHYDKFIGGILLINREQFELVDGLSNKYWGWGLEDDEFYVRLKNANLNFTRPENISTNTSNTFRHIHNKSRKRDTEKCYNQKEATRKRDRVTGLHDVQYKITSQNQLVIDNAPVTVISIQLFCDRNFTPWCKCD